MLVWLQLEGRLGQTQSGCTGYFLCAALFASACPFVRLKQEFRILFPTTGYQTYTTLYSQKDTRKVVYVKRPRFPWIEPFKVFLSGFSLNLERTQRWLQCFTGVTKFVIYWALFRVNVGSAYTGSFLSSFASVASWSGSWSTWESDRKHFVSMSQRNSVLASR